MRSFADRTYVGVVVHDDRNAQLIFQMRREREIAPATHVRGERHALGRETDGTAEADAAVVECEVGSPRAGYGGELGEHPLATALFVGGAGFAANEAAVVESGDGELRAADVDGQSGHGRSATP